MYGDYTGVQDGPNMARLLTCYWGRQQLVPKARIFIGGVFGIERGFTQGDPASTMIFNTVVGAVV